MSERIQFIVHSSVNDIDSGNPASIYGDLSQAVRIDLRHHYSGPICAEYWLALCRSRKYGHHNLVKLIDLAFPEVLDAIADVTRATGIEFVSLGPGNGQIDIQALRRISTRFNQCSYAAIDASFELLHYAACRVASAASLRLSFPIKAIWGNFAESGAVLPSTSNGAARLYSLTGFTLGNHREAALLSSIRDIMTDGDFLFMDAHLHRLERPGLNGHLTETQQRVLISGYKVDLSNRFAFGPVELATTALWTDVGFNYEINRSVTTVPNALNVITCCKGLRTRMRLTGEPVEHERLKLGSTTLYSYSDLADWPASQGFELIWRRRSEDVGLFLLRKRP
jgi:hypothetical protein